MATTSVAAPASGQAALTERQERGAVALISSAHLVSHYNQLAVIPLFPLLHDKLGASFIQLGLALTVFNVVSVVAQTPAGILVDRIGSRILLVAALILGGVAFIGLGAFTSYPILLAAMAVLGLANSVYHPADYDLLHGVVHDSRVGRAFSYHTFSGYVGSGAAPVLMLWMATAFGMNVAFAIAGCIGIAVALPLLFATQLDRRSHAAATTGTQRVGVRELLTPTILGFTFFFAMLSLSTSGISNFSIVALHAIDHIALALANIGLTMFLVGSALGILAGGAIADKTSRHASVALGGFVCCAIVTFAIGAGDVNGYAAAGLLGLAGFCSGLIMPSRDMLVRKHAPPGAMGRTFGIVTTGFNIGGAIGPMIFGLLLDRGVPRAIFFVSAGLMIVTASLPAIFEAVRRRRAAAMTTGLLALGIAFAAASGVAAAQTPVPSAAPSAAPNGFTAHAHATVSVAAGGGAFDVAVQLGVAQRDQATRFDVLSVRSPALPVRVDGIAIVVDRRAGTATVMNDNAKVYFTQSIVPSIAPRASPAPPRSGFADYEIFAASMRLTGHTTTLGMPSTGLAFDIETRKKNETASSNVAATLQLADDFAIFPLTFDLSMTPGAVPFGGKLSYAVDDLARALPPAALFATPAGYRHVKSPLEVLFATR